MRIIKQDQKGAESSSHTGSDEEDQGFKVKNDYTWKDEGGKLDFVFLEDSDGACIRDSKDNNGKAATRLQ